METFYFENEIEFNNFIDDHGAEVSCSHWDDRTTSGYVTLGEFEELTSDEIKTKIQKVVNKHFLNVISFDFYEEEMGDFKFRGYTKNGSFHITYNYMTSEIIVTIMGVDIKFKHGEI
jgi:hypothetical protein